MFSSRSGLWWRTLASRWRGSSSSVSVLMLVAIRYVQQRHLAENIRIKQLCELQPGMHSGDIWRKMLELISIKQLCERLDACRNQVPYMYSRDIWRKNIRIKQLCELQPGTYAQRRHLAENVRIKQLCERLDACLNQLCTAETSSGKCSNCDFFESRRKYSIAST